MDPNSVTQIANEVETEIFSGQLRPGDLLQQESLAKRFDVSRQPVREALQILEAKDLIARGADRSMAVLGLPDSASSEIIAIRCLLEPEALKLAMTRIADQDLLIARHALEHCEITENPAHLAEHDLNFHMALYRPCQNETMIQMIKNLRRTSTRAYLGQPLGSAARKTCNNSHRALLAACVGRKRKEAVSILLDHLRMAKDRNK